MTQQRHAGKKRRRSTMLVFLCYSSTASCERAYPLGCSQEPPRYYDYDNCSFPPPNLSLYSKRDFELTRRLGAGKFSDVFEAVSLDRELVVLKCLKPVSDRKIRRELLVLQHASQLVNLARLKGLVLPLKEDSISPMPSLVLQHAGPKSQWFCHGQMQEEHDDSAVDPFLSEYEIKYFLFHLLVALDELHSRGIMHRDVKPRNVLINRHSRESALMLIDLGLADFFLPDTRYNVRVASRHYKSPELLVGQEYYDYAIDMWGVGCMLAGLLFRREPFFRGKDNVDQLSKVVAVLGTDDLIAYCNKYSIVPSPEVRKIIAKQATRFSSRQFRGASWLTCISDRHCPMPSRAGLDLLDRLLVFDPDERLSAQQAMKHEFFDQVRYIVMAEVSSKKRLSNESQHQQTKHHASLISSVQPIVTEKHNSGPPVIFSKATPGRGGGSQFK